jgi:hypothetical protein
MTLREVVRFCGRVFFFFGARKRKNVWTLAVVEPIRQENLVGPYNP